MSDIDVARAAILDLGCEDYYHLADAATYLPSVAAEKRLDVAREAIRQLLSEGLIELHFGQFATNSFAVVPVNEALEVINDPRAWDVEAFHPNSYCFLNTDGGDRVYYRSSP
jgi:hypothetical protein